MNSSFSKILCFLVFEILAAFFFGGGGGVNEVTKLTTNCSFANIGYQNDLKTEKSFKRCLSSQKI